MTRKGNRRMLAALCALAAPAALMAGTATAQGTFDTALQLDTSSYTTLTVTVDGVPTTVRRYETVYVGAPIEMAATQPPRGVGPAGGVPSTDRRPLADVYSYQKMVIFVPETAVGHDDTAIMLHVNNSGWFASGPTEKVVNGRAYVSTSNADDVGAALKAGYIVASAGTRSRGAEAANGDLVGKAPAAVVDAKAAIRYLRLNDAALPGSAERIVITGFSGGGALSAAVAASGNSADYLPELARIGAAGVDAAGASTLKDSVFATLAYHPITDLGNADTAYEWQFGDVRTAANTAGGDHGTAAQAASAALSAAYPAYLASLNLTRADGTPLTAGTMDDELRTEILRETQERIAEGGAIPALGEDFTIITRTGTLLVKNDWLTIEAGVVTNIDLEKFLSFVAAITPLKVAPAFDATANTDRPYLRGENSLFGGPDVEYANFTAYGWDNNQVPGDGSGIDDTGLTWVQYIATAGAQIDDQLRMIDPFAYLSTTADTAPFWYLRWGMIDRDTSFPISLALANALRNDTSVQDVNFELSWLQGHSGGYDVQEAYRWLGQSLDSVGPLPAPVPLPATLPLALGGLAALGALSRRRR